MGKFTNVLTKRHHYLLGTLIFVLFALLVEVYLGWAVLLAPWLSLDPLALILAIALLLVSYALRSLRLYHYFAPTMAGRFLLCLRLMLQHNLFNNLLPMRSGELAFPLLMQRYFRITPMRSLPALLWFRVLDLHTLGLLALPTVALPLFGGFWTLFICVVWLAVPWLLFRWGIALESWLAKQNHRRLAQFAHQFIQGLPNHYTPFITSWWWTLANWSVKLWVFVWILRLFIDIPWLSALLGVIGGELTSVLPVHSLAGMGTYEAGIMAALLPTGIETRSALQGAVNLHLFLLAASLLGGMLTWLLPLRKEVPEPDHESHPEKK